MRRRSMLDAGVALAVLLLAWAEPAAAGRFIEQRVTSSQSGMNLLVRAWAEGDGAKVEFTQSDSEVMPEGSYLVTADRGETVFLVRPAEETYSVWDMDAMFTTLGKALEGAEGVVELDFQDPEAEDLGSEPGDELLGFDTTRRSWRTAYTMALKVAFMNRSHRLETTTEAWVTQEIEDPSLGIWFAVQPPTTGDPDLDYVLTQSMARIDGTPLKVVQRSKMTGKKGRGGKSTELTMEVTTIREEAVDDGIFVLPEGYEEVPLIDLGGQSAAQGKKDGKGSPLDSLGGLFGRKNKKSKTDG